jgi:glycosyltransferase involved in cell wall biosynthesis
MRIAIDARESGTSTGRYVDRLIEHIHKIGTDHEIIIMTKSHRLEYIKKIAPSFTVTAADFKEFTFSEQFTFLRFCRNLKVDLVHFSMVHQPVLYYGRTLTTMNDLTTARFTNPSKNPVVFWVKQQIYRLVNQWVARKAAHIITFTKYVKDDIIDYTGVSGEKITPIALAADALGEPPSPLKTLSGKQFIMYVGRPQPHKNLRLLIDAFVILQESHPNLHLVLAGNRDVLYDQHLAYIKQKGIKNVNLTGFVSDGELRWLYENCSAYCFPSLSEGFGLPSLEAMAHGAPVASSNASCLPEVNGKAAHYFDPLDVTDMAAKINDVLTNKKLRTSLTKKGYEQAKKFSWEETARKTLTVYEKILKK